MSQEVMTTELTEETEIITPGQLLAEGREKQGLSQEQVAEKLNFRSTLVKEIENNIFDRTLPSTFNRGYLKNYAKLVGIEAEQVLASYEALDDAEKQSAKLQSFSKGTEKQAQHNRIMWISYLILAALIGMTLLWYFQNDSKVEPVTPLQTQESTSKDTTEAIAAQPLEDETDNDSDADEAHLAQNSEVDSESASANSNNSPTQDSDAFVALSETLKQQAESIVIDVVETTESTTEEAAALQTPMPSLAVFNFSGDCWVNIYDATGERVAWGVKKTGYEMKIEGIAPFQVTLGKPELVTINFQGNLVDLSAFNKGNIAKFTLPLSES